MFKSEEQEHKPQTTDRSNIMYFIVVFPLNYSTNQASRFMTNVIRAFSPSDKKPSADIE